MASHAKWRKTYFSTPSAVTHQAYPFWTGEEFRNSKRGKKAGPWPSEAQIHAGTLCPDGQWRKVITVLDAQRGGCNLFNIDRLRLENDEDRFDQLYMCKFIDSTMSAFALSDLEGLLLGTLGCGRDYDPADPRPFGNYPVWLGYDPQPHPRRCHLRGGGAAPGAGRDVQDPGEAQLEGGPRSPTRPSRWKSSASASTCSTSGSTSPAWAMGCSTW